MLNRSIITLTLLLLTFLGYSQKDILLELGVNNKLVSEYNKQLKDISSKKKVSLKRIISLPFIDDFSQEQLFSRQ